MYDDDPRFIRTKIIATLGPASANRETLMAMFDAGLDVCRLNFSHGSLDEHARTLELVRTLADERRQPVCVIGDLCGPKIRVGDCPQGGVRLDDGQSIRVAYGDEACSMERLTVSYEPLANEVRPGERVLIDDGLIRLRVQRRENNELVCECIHGGVVRSHKGLNLPDSKLSTPALTDKDRRDLEWAVKNDLDYVALSFVRQPDDLYELQRAIKELGNNTPVIIKIEKPEALEHLDELIVQTDAVLVARGDLGVETELWRVPLIQKDLVARCQVTGTPVIVATQMLQSMIDNPVPTRAEVSDVANAIFEQADAVMLSGETAVGEYPVAAVRMMNRVAATTGAFLAAQPPMADPSVLAVQYHPTAAVAHAAVQAARDVNARLVAVWTATGASARRVARHRLPIPVLGLTYNERVYHQLALLYGVVPVCVEPIANPAEMAGALDTIVLDRDLAQPGDLIIVVTSTRPTTPGATDTVHVHRVAKS